MNLLVFYDSLLADIPGYVEQQREEINHRADLLRQQLNQRLVTEAAMDVHSVAPSALVPYLGTAIRCYLMGWYDVAIRDAAARLHQALCGRLLALVVWDNNERGTTILMRVGITATVAEVIANFRAGGTPFANCLPRAVIAAASEVGVLAGPEEKRVLAALERLVAQSEALDRRDADQGQQLAITAVENGAMSGGPGAVRTESVLGFYLTWGADLHHILADAVVAVCRVLETGNRQLSSRSSS